MRIIALDVHRSFAQMAVLENGAIRDAGKIDLDRSRLLHFANPNLVRAIAWAKVKTDKIDARVSAKLHASGFLPEVWMPEEETETRRRITAERTQPVAQMTRLKNRIHAGLHAHLIPLYQGSLFPKRRRAWLVALPLAEDQRRVILRHAGELDWLGAEFLSWTRASRRKLSRIRGSGS